MINYFYWKLLCTKFWGKKKTHFICFLIQSTLYRWRNQDLGRDNQFVPVQIFSGSSEVKRWFKTNHLISERVFVISSCSHENEEENLSFLVISSWMTDLEWSKETQTWFQWIPSFYKWESYLSNVLFICIDIIQIIRINVWEVYFLQ